MVYKLKFVFLGTYTSIFGYKCYLWGTQDLPRNTFYTCTVMNFWHGDDAHFKKCSGREIVYDSTFKSPRRGGVRYI